MNERAVKGVVVDAGHGGNDPGAVNGNVYEKDFNLEVSNYIYNRLRQLGIPAYITRSTDETLDRDERVRRILNAFGNDPNVIVLSNHINAGGGEGAEVVYALRNSDALAKTILDSIGEEGQIMRKYYQRRLPENPSKDYYFIHRLTGNTQPVLIEYGFIDNQNDLNKLQNKLLDYGEAVVRAVADYANVPYVSPDGTTDSNTYTVKRGDTLYSIANKFNVTVSELKSANNLTSNLLDVGQKLVIPNQQVKPETPNNYITYIVQRGDSLYKIANNYNTTVAAIMQANQLTNTTLSIGQTLLIPTANISPETDYYIVQLGDSLYNIAKKYNTTINDIIELNNLQTTVLQVGDKLLIPNYVAPPNDEEKPSINTEVYVVQAGDSLYNIAKKYNTTVDEIKRVNNLTSNLLSVGQRLMIPGGQGYINYVVKSGDSLYAIARNYNTTVSEIKKLNNLTSELLSIGQVLQIPA